MAVFLSKQKGRRKGQEQRQIFIGGGGGSCGSPFLMASGVFSQLKIKSEYMFYVYMYLWKIFCGDLQKKKKKKKKEHHLCLSSYGKS